MKYSGPYGVEIQESDISHERDEKTSKKFPPSPKKALPSSVVTSTEFAQLAYQSTTQTSKTEDKVRLISYRDDLHRLKT